MNLLRINIGFVHYTIILYLYPLSREKLVLQNTHLAHDILSPLVIVTVKWKGRIKGGVQYFSTNLWFKKILPQFDLFRGIRIRDMKKILTKKTIMGLYRNSEIKTIINYVYSALFLILLKWSIKLYNLKWWIFLISRGPRIWWRTFKNQIYMALHGFKKSWSIIFDAIFRIIW